MIKVIMPAIRPPIPRAVRMAAWAPPAGVSGPSGRKSLGFSFNFDGTTVLAAAGGVGAILLSDSFDAPTSTLVKVGGFAALAYAAYSAFIKAPSSSEGELLHSLAPGTSENPQGTVNDLRGAITLPTRGGSADVFSFFGTSYPIEFSVRNAGGLPVSFVVQFKTTEYAKYGSQDTRMSSYSVALAPGETKVMKGSQPFAFGTSIHYPVNVVAELVAITAGGKFATLASSSFTAD